MKYTKRKKQVLLEMESEEYDLLMMAIGSAIASADRSGRHDLAFNFLRFANDLNRTNPEWEPFKIDEARAAVTVSAMKKHPGAN